MEGKTLGLAVAILVLSVANSLAMKRMTNAVPNYPSFLSLLHVTACTLLFVGAVWLRPTPSAGEDKKHKRAETKSECLPKGSLLAPRAWGEKGRFVVLAALDALAGVLTVIGSVHTAGSLQQLLWQVNVPVTMALSSVLLRRVFTKTQVVGAVVIVSGVVIVLSPWSAAASASTNHPAYNLLFVSAVLPMALGSLFKETVLRDGGVDDLVLNAEVAKFQVGFSLLLLPLSALPMLGGNALPLQSQLVAGPMCLLGIDSVVEDCVGWGEAGGVACDRCEGAWVPVFAYIAVNAAYNVVLTSALKHVGSSMLALLSTLKLPVTNLAFSLPLLMGDQAEAVEASSVVGLVVIVAGLGVYRGLVSWPAAKRKQG